MKCYEQYNGRQILNTWGNSVFANERLLKAVKKAAIKRRPSVIHGDWWYTLTLVIWQLRESLEQINFKVSFKTIS
jgi:hypothetical protein